MKSLQHIGAAFKKSAELTYDHLAVHLHNKVSHFEPMSAYYPLTDHCPHFLQMSNHTINLWKKYCLYHKNAIEDLCKRAISNAEKKAISKGAANATVTEAIGATQPIPQQVDPRQPAPQQPLPPLIVLPQSIMGTPRSTSPLLCGDTKTVKAKHVADWSQVYPQPTIPQPTTSQPAIPQPTIPQQAALQPVISQQVTLQQVAPQQQISQSTTPQQPTPQPVIPQQATTAHESQQPPPHKKVPKLEPVLVKTEPLEEDELDFAFATEVLSGWNPNEESDAALWKRMETTVCSLIFPWRPRAANVRSQWPSATELSWEAYCVKHWSRFELFFVAKSIRARTVDIHKSCRFEGRCYELSYNGIVTT